MEIGAPPALRDETRRDFRRDALVRDRLALHEVSARPARAASRPESCCNGRRFPDQVAGIVARHRAGRGEHGDQPRLRMLPPPRLYGGHGADEGNLWPARPQFGSTRVEAVLQATTTQSGAWSAIRRSIAASTRPETSSSLFGPRGSRDHPPRAGRDGDRGRRLQHRLDPGPAATAGALAKKFLSSARCRR